MLESIKYEIIAADSAGMAILLIFLGLLCGAGLYGVFRFFHRSRIIDDTPTSKIRSAHQGFVELEGEGCLMKGMPIVSPLSNRQCLWYSYKIQQRIKNGWETVDSGISKHLFLLVDDTGICVVDPENATITPSFSKIWYGPKNSKVFDHASASSTLQLEKVATNNYYRYTEKRIEPGDELYLLGRFKTVGGRREKLDKKGEIRELLAKWKNRPDFLLARFDDNGDGEIDLQEWQKVIAVAEQEVEKSFGERLVQPETHILSEPIENRRPFIISVESQQDIANKYRWYSRGSLLVFFLGGSSFVWILGIRLAS